MISKTVRTLYLLLKAETRDLIERLDMDLRIEQIKIFYLCDGFP